MKVVTASLPSRRIEDVDFSSWNSCKRNVLLIVHFTVFCLPFNKTKLKEEFQTAWSAPSQGRSYLQSSYTYMFSFFLQTNRKRSGSLKAILFCETLQPFDHETVKMRSQGNFGG